jgi:hypothetical protein
MKDNNVQIEIKELDGQGAILTFHGKDHAFPNDEAIKKELHDALDRCLTAGRFGYAEEKYFVVNLQVITNPPRIVGG